MTSYTHTSHVLSHVLSLTATCLAAGYTASAAMYEPIFYCTTDSDFVQLTDTACGWNSAQKEYLDMKKDETVMVIDAGEGNCILLATAARERNRGKVTHIWWVPRDIRRYGRVNKEIRERRNSPHAYLSGIPIRKLIMHTPAQDQPFFSIATSDNLVLADGQAYDSNNAAHHGQALYTVWEEHRISTDAGNWLRLLIDNQLSTQNYQGPSIPTVTTTNNKLKEPQKIYGATEEEWRNAVMPDVR